MASIRQIPSAHFLPDWRNLGVILRLLLGVNGMVLLVTLALARSVDGWFGYYVRAAAWVEPLLLIMVCLFVALRDILWRLPARSGQACAIALTALVVWLQYDFWAWLGMTERSSFESLQVVVLSATAMAVLLGYFELRVRAFSPAMAEARLAALNARIRPHFLFNSLNTVLSLIRAEPRRAELALEALADLFRSALRDQKELVPLSDEIALGRQYLDLEKLRLGERLQVDWHIDDLPVDTLIPPLMLQPLLENAVYHGVETLPEGGAVHIGFARKGDELRVEIRNPLSAGGQHAAGNRMAATNIRDRLALYYDLEARMEIEASPSDYLVRIILPCRTSNDRSPS